MRPPAIQLSEEITLFNRGISNPMFTLITHEDHLIVSRGSLRIEDDGKTVFDDLNSENTAYLDFQSMASKNHRILKRALSAAYQNDVPNFHSFGGNLVKPDVIGMDEYWVGALALSRAEITQFIVYYITVDIPKNVRMALLQRAPEPNLESILKEKYTPNLENGVNWSWYPTAKPGNLQSWLRDRAQKEISDNTKETIFGALSPLIEGYYRVAPVSRSDGKENPVKIIYDDSTFMESDSYFDLGDKTQDPDQRLIRPHDRHRGKLTVSTPLCISSSDDEGLDWGFSGLSPLGWLFLLPLGPTKNRRFLMGPVRVSLKGETRFRTTLKRERLEHFKEEGVREKTQELFFPLEVDAKLNLGDMPTSTLLTSPSPTWERRMKEGIEKTLVREDDVPIPLVACKGKMILLPRRLLVRKDVSIADARPGTSGAEDDVHEVGSAPCDDEKDGSSLKKEKSPQTSKPFQEDSKPSHEAVDPARDDEKPSKSTKLDRVSGTGEGSGPSKTKQKTRRR